MKRIGGLVIAAAWLAAGCGGGNSGAGTPPTGFSITGSNGQAAAKVSYLAAVQTADMAGLVGNTGIVADPGGGFPKTMPLGQLAKPITTAVSSVPFGPDTLPCGASGSITVSGDIANPLTLTEGDVIRIEATNCDDGLGEAIDGRIDFTVASFSGDIFSGLYDMTMDLVITDFQVTTVDDTVLSNGDSRVMLNTLNTPAVSASVSGNSMTTDAGASTETMTNYLSAQTLDAGVSPSPYTMDSSATLNSSQLGGVVDYSTEIVFQGFDTDFPSSGELLVTASDNSSARLIAVDNINVRIEIDSDGDGVVDETIDATWADLTS